MCIRDSFGDALIQAREARGYSRTAFADLLGIPYTTLRNYETNQREPGHKLLIKIADILNISIDNLVGRTSKKDILSPAELEHIKKYRRIDSDGKATIDMMLDQLVQKAEAEQPTEPQILRYAAKGGGVKDYVVKDPKRLEQVLRELDASEDG